MGMGVVMDGSSFAYSGGFSGGYTIIISVL